MRFWVGSLIVAGLAGSVGIAAGQDQRPTFRASVQRVAVAAAIAASNFCALYIRRASASGSFVRL